tara:strand:+ start:5711 stop:6034 length:324 start_codon:yes stop_codon:yes gene_type:complete
MDKRSYIIESANNGDPIIVDQSVVGFSPADTMHQIQVSVTGLDGGTYSVQFLPVSGFGYVDFESGVAETSAVLLNNGFLADAVKVSFSTVGQNGDPKACITFIRRSF